MDRSVPTTWGGGATTRFASGTIPPGPADGRFPPRVPLPNRSGSDDGGRPWVPPLAERDKAVGEGRAKLRSELDAAAERRRAVHAAIAEGVLRPKRPGWISTEPEKGAPR